MTPRPSPPFDYTLPYRDLDLRRQPALYRVGKGEQGVLLVEPYKSEILPLWRFRDPATARRSARAIRALFAGYKRARDFVGMDMARKFLQMGYTRARRYANHASGRKYGPGRVKLPDAPDAIKAASAVIFKRAWDQVEADAVYARLKAAWKLRYG